MTIAIGTDIVEIKRIADALERQGDKFVQRILTESEIAEYQLRGHSVSYLAKRFAAKEAIAKALGTGIGRGNSFQQMVVSNNAARWNCSRAIKALDPEKHLGHPWYWFL